MTLSSRNWLWFGFLLALVAYFYGLDGLDIPKNGDEYPYAQITRKTAEAGHWLPLRSDQPDMRNTKPPLLFWQGILSTDWGRDWQHWRLRWPVVLYTLLSAAVLVVVGRRLGAGQTGLVAGLTFLAFITSYRYGRPFLTDSPLTFWLLLPTAALLAWPRAMQGYRWWFSLLGGVSLGLGYLYKSFFLAVPAGLTLAWWYLDARHYDWRSFVRRDLAPLALMAVTGVALFSLWLLLDPDPQAIIDEFILQENVGKVVQPNYVGKLLWGGSSIWSQLIGLLLNCGLLAPPAAAVLWLGWRRRNRMERAERWLWIWLGIYFLVFLIPTQRSARYLIPAMPALALLLALYWSRIPRWVFRLSLLLALVFEIGFLVFAIKLQTWLPQDIHYPLWFWILYVLAIGMTSWAMVATVVRNLVPVVAMVVYLVMSLYFLPFEGPLGRFPSEAVAATRGHAVCAPYNFNAKDELYRFLMPGAEIVGYHTGHDHRSPTQLMADCPYLILNSTPDTPPHFGACTILGWRLATRSRQNGREIREVLFENRLEHLFTRQWLIRCPVVGSGSKP
ncbi:glycosyltransferase family 39 protein [Alcanivorax sp.]|uniref:ArnT family glycosyltransferase n=1 Tax=Alcanivorax sp. TaxID=1872427 RepID=UPI0025905B8C|nr:glycosyltransferase family 39 protein [Alcanivorax sp.]